MDTNSNLRPAQKGEVRNTKGRGKGAKNRGTIIKKWLGAKSTGKSPISQRDETLSQEDWMIIGMIGAARRGNVRAFEILMDAKYGAVLHRLGFGLNGDSEPDSASGDSFISFEVVEPNFAGVIELEIGAE